VEAEARWVDYPVLALAASPDGALLAAAGGPEGTIELYPLDGLAGSRPIVLAGHGSAVAELAFTPDGTGLISAPSQAAEGDGIRLWSLAEISAGETGSSQVLVPGPARALAVSPDGSLLAVARDGVYLWSLADGAAPPRLLPNSVARTNSLAFSADGALLLAGGDGARLWQLDVPEALPVSIDVRGVEAVAFAPDGMGMLLGARGRTYHLPGLEALPDLACAQVRRNLTWAEWRAYLPGEPYRATCPALPADPAAPAARVPDRQSSQLGELITPVAASHAILFFGAGAVLWRRRSQTGER
jgi:WD40 repeat protein